MIIIININKFLAWAFDNQWANNHDFYDLFEKYMFQCTVLSLLLLPAKNKDKKKMKVFFIGKKNYWKSCDLQFLLTLNQLAMGFISF